MSRWVLFVVCGVLGLAMLVCGLLVPAHLRAVDASVLQLAGRNTPALSEYGLTLASQGQLGAAQLLLQAAQQLGIPGQETLGPAITNLATQNPASQVWGGAAPRFGTLFETDPGTLDSTSGPFTEFVVRLENRERALRLLYTSPCPAVQELVRCRELTNTVIFPPSQSESGQAFDAAISVCGLLLDEGRFAPGLSNTVFTLAAEANRGASPQRLEQTLADIMSLGQRFNWGRLTAFVSGIEDTETLRLLANFVRKADAQLPVLFTIVQFSGKPGAVAQYLLTFNQTGLKDLGESLRFGAGGLNELLQRHQRMHSSSLRPRLLSDYCLRMPGFALSVKWFLYLAGGFLLAAALHFARPATSELERPLQVRGFHVAREVLFALGFLLVVLLLSEPFLTQESQKVDFRFQLRLPTMGAAVPVGTPGKDPSPMNNKVLLTMLLFFVLQSLLYLASVVKLAEIRRQRVPAGMKLKLLENEDHLFDAGLYLGFLGTIVSLILASLGVFKQTNLMAAYSSTSFGILFVVLFKVVHLRPARRKLLLEAEASSPAPAEPSHSFAAPL